MTDRTQLIEHIQFAFPELTDQALHGLSAFVDMLPRRPLTSEALAEAQRQREAPLLFERMPCAHLHDSASDAAAVIGAAGTALVCADDDDGPPEEAMTARFGPATCQFRVSEEATR